MTKYDQALDDAAKSYGYKDYSDAEFQSSTSVIGGVIIKQISRRAADLHAQRFAEWVARKTWSNYKSEDGTEVIWLMYVDNISHSFTTAQLMERYNQQEEQNNG